MMPILDKSRNFVTLAVYSASGLQHSPRMHGTCDAYIKLIFGQENAKTEVAYNTQNPIWNQLFCFQLCPGYSSRFQGIELHVYDHNDIRADSLIGKVLLEWHHVAIGGAFSVPILNEESRDQSMGTLLFKLMRAEVLPEAFKQGLKIGPENLREIEMFDAEKMANEIEDLKAEQDLTSINIEDLFFQPEFAQHIEPASTVHFFQKSKWHITCALYCASFLKYKKGTLDTYTSITVGEEVAISSVFSNSHSPVWNQLFCFEVPSGFWFRSEGIKLQVYEHNDIRTDVCIGSIVVEWQNFIGGAIYALPIAHEDSSDRIKGTIFFQLFDAQISLGSFQQGMLIQDDNNQLHHAIQCFSIDSSWALVTHLKSERKLRPQKVSDLLQRCEDHFSVLLLSASELPKVDFIGSCDAYIKFKIGDTMVAQSQHVPDCQQPIFNCLFSFNVSQDDRISSPGLTLELFDHNSFTSDRYLGEILIEWSHIFLGGNFNVPIHGDSQQGTLGKTEVGFLNFQIFNAKAILQRFKQGVVIYDQEIQAMREFAEESENELIQDLSVKRKQKRDFSEGDEWFETSDYHLLVAVLSASGLPRMDVVGLSDPYIHIFVGDDMQKTDIKYITLTPEWNQLFCFHLNPLYPPSKNLIKFECFDHDYGKSDDFIGDALLQWEDVDGSEKELQLYSAGLSQGRIKVVAAKCRVVSSEFTQGIKIDRFFLQAYLQKILNRPSKKMHVDEQQTCDIIRDIFQVFGKEPKKGAKAVDIKKFL